MVNKYKTHGHMYCIIGDIVFRSCTVCSHFLTNLRVNVRDLLLFRLSPLVNMLYKVSLEAYDKLYFDTHPLDT